MEEAFDPLEAPVARVTGGTCRTRRRRSNSTTCPSVDRIADAAIRETVKY